MGTPPDAVDRLETEVGEPAAELLARPAWAERERERAQLEAAAVRFELAVAAARAQPCDRSLREAQAAAAWLELATWEAA